MSIVRHNKQEQFNSEGQYHWGLSVPMDTDEDDDNGDGGSAVVQRDHRSLRHIDPNPTATNADLRGSFEYLEPRRRRHLTGWIADRIEIVEDPRQRNRFIKHLYGPAPLTREILFRYRSYGRTIPGRYGIRGLCSTCRALGDQAPRKCFACGIYQRVPENPLFDDWSEFLTARADELLLEAARKELGPTTDPKRAERWLRETALFRTTSMSIPSVYTQVVDGHLTCPLGHPDEPATDCPLSERREAWDEAPNELASEAMDAEEPH